MRANYPGTCAACGKYHIRVGDKIERRLSGYASARCVREAEAIRCLTGRIGTAMQEREGIALGVVAIPAGCQSTTTRERFYSLALQLEHCTPEEFTTLANYYAGQGSWQRALDD